MPRFGLPWFAHRLPREIGPLALQVRGVGVGAAFELTAADLEPLERRDLVADFHCVTTWSCRQQSWSGYVFRDVFEQLILPRASLRPKATHVRFKGVDGYTDTLLLEDALADDVLLADRHFGAPLLPAHGAPLRLVAPAHYGNKNVKHLCAIELRSNFPFFRNALGLAHDRGRVAYEERGRGLPGRALRGIFRLLARPTLRLFCRYD
jgi:DMSO/TMAO reductase YedYZ molybdopterin-dependent catalytic subunit